MAKAFVKTPAAGKPGGAASRFLRVDFRPTDEFDSLIETKTPRLGWARATLCPCVGLNDQTKQLDPSCPQCNGLGWAYFRPPTYSVNTETLGTFTKEQQATLNRAEAVAIRGLMISVESDPDMFRVLGSWSFGSAKLTVRGQNRLGYYDRIISIDESIVRSETTEADGSGKVKLKYLTTGVNDLRSLTTQYDDTDVELVDGEVIWKPGVEPATGTRLSVNYLFHPVWVVLQHLHVVRTSLARYKAPPKTLQTPEGDNISLPVQAVVRLEHLDLTPKDE